MSTKAFDLTQVLLSLKKKRNIKVRNNRVHVLMKYKTEADTVGNKTLGKLDYLKTQGFTVEMLEDSIENSEIFKKL